MAITRVNIYAGMSKNARRIHRERVNRYAQEQAQKIYDYMKEIVFSDSEMATGPGVGSDFSINFQGDTK